MTKRATLLVIFAILTIGIIWLVGCRDDVVVPFPPSLAGDYEGVYELQRIDGIDTMIDTTNNVTVRFTATTYTFTVVDSIIFFCSTSGEYELSNGVQFTEEDDNRFNDVCTPTYNPVGSFGITFNTGTDTILMKQDRTDSLGVRSIKTMKVVDVTGQ